MIDPKAPEWTPASVDNERSWAALEQSIRDIHGGRVYVVLVDPPSAQRSFISKLQEKFPRLVAYRMREQDIAPVAMAREALAGDPSAPLALYGFEWWSVPGKGAEYKFFIGLNMQRNSLFELLKAPLLLILSTPLLPDLMHDAPDFFSTVSGTFRFEFKPETVLELTRDAPFFERDSIASIEDLRRRRTELEERLHLIPETNPPSRDRCLTEMSLGETLALLGKLADGLDHLQEATRGFEQMRSLVGDTPQALQDELCSLDRIADVLLALGRAQEALDRYERSLELSRSVRSIVGDTPEALRDESVPLEKTANVLRSLGLAKEALDRYERSLELRRTIRSVVGETPQALRDESVLLIKTADVLLALGRAQEALDRYERSLELFQTIRSSAGDTLQALRDESISLDRTADVLRSLGRTQEALGRYERSLELFRTLRSIVGDTPQALRDESVSLNKTADVLLALGRAQEALDRYERSLELSRTLRSIVGDTPQALRDEMVGWYKLAGMTGSGRGCDACREALALAQRLADGFPDVPLYATDLENVQQLQRDLGC